ncbi:MAG: electron transfer flavoprotein subunit beta/FixA family protein [Armatimonadetes bacterium]|nr:electron transfer flavoprotein subunit beta/FixA family protein [Armatimonadota bacterium]
MKIMVTVKRVIDPYAKVRPLSDGSGVDTTGVKFDANPFDEIAVEEAVRQKEKNPVIEIVAVSLGGTECEEQLRKALAMGADKAVLIESSENYDTLAVAEEFVALVKAESPDLVLMGKQSTDGDNNQVGQMMAALLGWPQATFASKLELADGTARVTRETDTGEETLEMNLPAIVTTDLRLNEPRYIALPGIIKARSKPLEKRPPSSTATSRVKTVKVEAVPARSAGKKVGSVDELVAELSARGLF